MIRFFKSIFIISTQVPKSPDTQKNIAAIWNLEFKKMNFDIVSSFL